MQALFRLCLLVAGNVLVALDVGAYGEVEGCLVSLHHADISIRATHLAALGLYSHTPHKAHLAFQTFMLGRNTQERSFVAIHIHKYILMRTGHVGDKCNLAFLAGCQVDNDNFVTT